MSVHNSHTNEMDIAPIESLLREAADFQPEIAPTDFVQTWLLSGRRQRNRSVGFLFVPALAAAVIAVLLWHTTATAPKQIPAVALDNRAKPAVRRNETQLGARLARSNAIRLYRKRQPAERRFVLAVR